MEDGKRDSDGTVGLGGDTDIPVDETKKAMVQKPGALKIYDNALSDDFCDDLISVFDSSEPLEVKDEKYDILEYNYTLHHKEEDVHARLMEHTAQLYKHYLEDLGTTNMINVSGFEELKIKKFGFHDLHIEAVDHASAIRAVGFMFFLNDSTGNVDWPLQYMGVEPKKGRVIIYPVSWEYPNRHHKSVESDKYMLETFLHFA